MQNTILVLATAAAMLSALPVTRTGDALAGGASTTFATGTNPLAGTDSVTLVPMPGWPKHVGTNPNYKPSGITLADINHDSTLEIIVGSTDNTLNVWDYQGNSMPGWPKTLPGMIQSKVAVGDINRDGTIEIVAAARNGYVYVYTAGGDPVPGWPQSAGGSGGFVSPTLFDIDGDDTLEVIQAQYPPGTVNVWRADGTVYPGWPKTTDNLAVATASVGDVDSDGGVEICVPSYRSLYLWDKDGNDKPGWPITLGDGASYSQPELYDLDGDGKLEIGFASYPNGNPKVFMFRYDGSNQPGWPKSMISAQPFVCPVAGGVLSDSVFSIFCGGHLFGSNGFYGWKQDGGAMAGWPVAPDFLECSPIVFDLEGDWTRCVMIASNTTPGALYAYHADGSLVDGFPFATPDAALPNSPAVADVDGDGVPEIGLLTQDGSVSLWKVEGVEYHPYMTDWGTWFHDNWNTGQLHPRPPQGLTASHGDQGVHLAWRNYAEWHLACYNVYRSTAPDAGFRKLAALTDTVYDDTSVHGDTTFYYAVTVVKEYAVESRLSTVVPFNPASIEEMTKPEVRMTNPLPTVVRHVLFLPPLPSAPSSLLSTDGRKVMNLQSGPNDVSVLAPGVYFVRAVSGKPSAVSCHKVVIQR